MARAMGDQLAQDGFIAIVPDFLSGKGMKAPVMDSYSHRPVRAVPI
jgi:dienelactone hydrolase